MIFIKCLCVFICRYTMPMGVFAFLIYVSISEHVHSQFHACSYEPRNNTHSVAFLSIQYETIHSLVVFITHDGSNKKSVDATLDFLFFENDSHYFHTSFHTEQYSTAQQSNLVIRHTPFPIRAFRVK